MNQFVKALFLKKAYTMKIIVFCVLVCSFAAATAQDSLYSKTELIYGRKDGMALPMLMLTPAKKENGRAIINIVSGNWISNYGMTSSAARHSLEYLNRGYRVFLVMHGSQPRYAIPDQIADIKQAVRFIRHNASRYNIDSNKIGITGASSGGHLSLMVALETDSIIPSGTDPVSRTSARVQAAAVFFPPTDFLHWGNADPALRKQMMIKARVSGAFDFKKMNAATGLYESIKDDSVSEAIAKTVSPIYAVSKDDPPVMIAHGDADPIVPIQQSLTIIDALKRAGVTNEFIKREKGSHGWRDSDVEEKRFADWFDRWLK